MAYNESTGVLDSRATGAVRGSIMNGLRGGDGGGMCFGCRQASSLFLGLAVCGLAVVAMARAQNTVWQDGRLLERQPAPGTAVRYNSLRPLAPLAVGNALAQGTIGRGMSLANDVARGRPDALSRHARHRGALGFPARLRQRGEHRVAVWRTRAHVVLRRLAHGLHGRVPQRQLRQSRVARAGYSAEFWRVCGPRYGLRGRWTCGWTRGLAQGQRTETPRRWEARRCALRSWV